MSVKINIKNSNINLNYKINFKHNVLKMKINFLGK